MSYLVSVTIANPWGICLEGQISREDYVPFSTVQPTISTGSFNIYIYNGISQGTQEVTWRIQVDFRGLMRDYIRRVYELSDDVEVTIGLSSVGFNNRHASETQQTFETEAEALEYVDTLGNPDPLMYIPSSPDQINPTLVTASWREQIEGVWIDRTAEVNYTGDRVTIYTLNDLINFYALFLGVTAEEALDQVLVFTMFGDRDLPPEPSLDCETYMKAIIAELGGPDSPIEIDIDFTGSSIPDDSTVTIIVRDGDPPADRIENGDGAVTIHDNGNIIMSNDGGTFFLNEFGNVGFYANSDASLTANNQVQLGVGQNSVTVENGSLTIRDETGSATLTAEQINRLKETLT